MKRLLLVAVLIAALLVVGLLLAGCGKSSYGTNTGASTARSVNPEPGRKAPASTTAAPAAATVYTCPMHPEVTSDKPGKCPKCGMNLVPKAK